MTREDGVDLAVASGRVHGSPWPLEAVGGANEYIDTEEEDADESDGDFELEAMDEDDEDDDDDLAHITVQGDEQSLRDELMALATAGGDDDTIAHRTRTKFSLVDVEIDSLESLLPPDPVDGSLGSGETEYQRFLASLLPTGAEEDNLSFLDEEDEEYRPDEEEDDDEEDEDERRRKESGEQSVVDDDEEDELEQQSVRVTKRELTELLWDSTQIKVPPTFAKLTHSGNATEKPTFDGREKEQISVVKLERTTSSGKIDRGDAASLSNLTGSISQEQCILLASQMHKHFQLLLQTYHMVTNNESKPREKHDKKADKPSPKLPVDKDQLKEVEEMLRELQVRGKRALEHKAQLLSKLTMGRNSNSRSIGDDLGERRVTRSISAAHAAVAHPSMFDIVGSQSMEELTETFARGCSVSDRNQLLHKSMVEVDQHILLNRKKRRGNGNRSTTFLWPEDRLLLHGVKRYGIEAEAWGEIKDTLLPTKEVAVLSKRYRYLASKKKRAGAKEFKEYHTENSTRKKGPWMIEEDVRIARGVVEYFGDNRRFARISSKYLPHRHRLEIRKRWERLKELYRVEDGTVIEKVPLDSTVPARAAAREFATAVKLYFEAKLRKQLTNAGTTLLSAQPLPVPPASSKSKVKSAPKVAPQDQQQPQGEYALDANGCGTKNLHPALFFSSWAVIHPATLLERTCEHNWPAFIKEKRRDITSESTLDLVTRAAASHVEEETASHRMDFGLRNHHLPPIGEDDDIEHGSLIGDEVDLSLDRVDSNEEDEDSDFEREELLSSEAEESESEYERMEFSDDDEENDDEDEDGESYDEADASHNEREPLSKQLQHPLRLENLRRPGDKRAERALEALERRLTGSKPFDAESSTGFTPLRFETTTFEPLPADTPFGDEDELDLLSYEQLSESASSEEDGEFEQDELYSSSDEEPEQESAQDQGGDERLKRSHGSSDGIEPAKRPRLNKQAPSCAECSGVTCICASKRMQSLMDRIHQRGANSMSEDS